MAKKKKKAGAKAAGAPLPEDTIELHLPAALYARIDKLTDPDKTELLRILFDCNSKDSSIYGVNKVKLYNAQTRVSGDGFIEPRKVCNGP